MIQINLPQNLPGDQAASVFEKDILDLFLGLKTAHLSAHTFQHGAALWEDFFNTPSDYYVVRDEINLIREHALSIRKHCGRLHTIIDFGPGSERAVEQKTLPILNAFKYGLKNYCAVDISQNYLSSADQVVKNAYPDIENHLFCQNFFDDLVIPMKTPRLGLLFGLTLTNMPGIYNKESGIEYLRKEMKIFRKIMQKGSYLLCSYDACQNEERLMKAYKHPKHAVFIESIASKIKSDLLPDSNFDAEAWFYNPKWDAKHHMFKHILTSKKPMDFTLGKRSFHLPEGYDIVSYMSVKFPSEIYLKIFKEAGFRLMFEPLTGPHSDINIALLEAI